MRILSAKIQNVLSYEDVEIEFNKNLNIFIGANGSGKSNLINILIFALKRYCFKNYTINRIDNPNDNSSARYSIQESFPIFGASAESFLKKHKNHTGEPSSIEIKLSFDRNDIENLAKIKKRKDEIYSFISMHTDVISKIPTAGDPYDNRIMLGDLDAFFNLRTEQFKPGQEYNIRLNGSSTGTWEVINNKSDNEMIYASFFEALRTIADFLGYEEITEPFVFFEAYRNNNRESTIATTVERGNMSNTSSASLSNMRNIANSIGANGTFINMTTKKIGKIHRNTIEESNGLSTFEENEEYKKLKELFGRFDCKIKIKCIEPENNVYQFFVEKKDGTEIEIDAISSGEREIMNFICGFFLGKLRNGIVFIDEPELHLHPRWQKRLVQILKDQAEEQEIQIFFVTHSSNFIIYKMINDIFRVYMKNGGSQIIRLDNHPDSKNSAEETRKNLAIINATSNEKIFFSDYIVLVEGVTDEALFKRIYEKENGRIPDNLEFVRIEGKTNFKNFANLLKNLRITFFYIGDYDNLYDYPELKEYFKTDKRSQNKDLKEKNKSFAALGLLESIECFLKNPTVETYRVLEENYRLYNERFLKKKNDISINEEEAIANFIKEKYEENIFILKRGEIEDYLGTGKTSKAKGFDKTIQIVESDEEYNKFKVECPDFDELKNIVKKIADTIND